MKVSFFSNDTLYSHSAFGETRDYGEGIIRVADEVIFACN